VVSWIERIRFGGKPIPPRSVVADGFWRLDDPLPTLVHYLCGVAATAEHTRWLGVAFRGRKFACGKKDRISRNRSRVRAAFRAEP
jgi:hypothetical protein